MSRNSRDFRFKKKSPPSGQSGISGLQSGRLKIVSNAQTGISRGVLDAAIELGAECGGACAEGRMAEDGFIPDNYPVAELVGEDTSESIRQNVKQRVTGQRLFIFAILKMNPKRRSIIVFNLGNHIA